MIYFSKAHYELPNFVNSVAVDDFLSSDECSKLIALMPERKLQEALISEQGVKNTSIRQTRLCALEFTKHTEWIFHKLEQVITEINEQVYRFELLGIKDAIQLMEYTTGSFYGQHMDMGPGIFSHRKLSFTVQLSDPEDYEGGILKFNPIGEAPKAKGTICLFPSFIYHEVLPIKTGVRRALVGWCGGVPFR